MNEKFKNLLNVFKSGRQGVPEQNPPTKRSPELKRDSLHFEVGAEIQASKEHPQRTEDTPYLNKKAALFAVFDSMGGESSGQLSSIQASEALNAQLQSMPMEIQPLLAQRVLIDTIQDIHTKLHELGRVITNATGQETSNGSTAIIAKLHNFQGKNYLTYAKVGDSRLYMLRQGQLHCLTVDHNRKYIYFPKLEGLAKQRQDSNSYDASALYGSNELTYALGLPDSRNRRQPAQIQVEVETIDILPGDRVALFSDGITDNLTENPVPQNKSLGNFSIQEVLSNNSTPEGAAKVAVTVAQEFSSRDDNARSKPDDTTAIVLDIK